MGLEIFAALRSLRSKIGWKVIQISFRVNQNAPVFFLFDILISWTKFWIYSTVQNGNFQDTRVLSPRKISDDIIQWNFILGSNCADFHSLCKFVSLRKIVSYIGNRMIYHRRCFMRIPSLLSVSLAWTYTYLRGCLLSIGNFSPSVDRHGGTIMLTHTVIQKSLKNCVSWKLCFLVSINWVYVWL